MRVRRYTVEYDVEEADLDGENDPTRACFADPVCELFACEGINIERIEIVKQETLDIETSND